jgi:hypothetical protein
MRLAPALLALTGVALGRGVDAAPVRYGARAEAGAEYDTNPGRTEEIVGRPATPPIEGSPLGRAVLSADAAAVAGRHALTASFSVAGKRFTRAPARDDDVLVLEGSAAWLARLGAGTGVGLGGQYYDAFQRRTFEARDFRTLTPTLRLDQAVGPTGQLSVGAGYRWFTYKPDAELDFRGPTAFALYRRLFPGEQPGDADWEWSGGASVEARAFTGVRCIDPSACPGPPGTARRRDQFWMGHLEATRTGSFLLGAGVAVDDNASNSYGEAVVRALGHLRVAVALPADLVLSARAELVAAFYRDAIPLARPNVGAGGLPGVSIEDERRSTARAELVRPLGPHLDLGARYTFFTNEIAAGPVHFRRHTALLFMAFTVGP